MAFSAGGSQPGTGSITAYEWRSNGTVISNLPVFNFPFAAASHTITLKVTNSAGLSSTATATIVVTESATGTPKAVIFMNGGGKSGGNGSTLNYTVLPGGSISMSLDGSGSTPGSGTLATYEWRSNGTIINNGKTFTFAFGVASHSITLKVTNSSGVSDIATATIVVAADTSAPQVSSVNPNPVPTFNADQNVQVLGSNFQTGLTVDVFNSVGSKIATLSGTQIQGVTPSSFTMVVSLGISPSTFGIEVVNPSGGRSPRFTFTTITPTPSVSSLNPATPPVVNGNQNVQVSGGNFQSGLTVDVFNSAGTKLGTLSGTQVLNVTPNSFTMVVNLGSVAGTFGIEVVNPSGGRSSRFTFSTQATGPTVSSVSPSPVPTFNANQNVQVFGSNFQTNLTVDIFNSGGAKIATLSGTQVLNVTGTSFTMVVNLGSSASTFGIEVVNPDGGRSPRFNFSTTAPSPAVGSISPNPVPVVNGNQNVQVFGSNFQFNLTVDVFNSGGTKVGTLSGTQVLNVTPTSFTMVINLGSTASTFGIEVVNPSGGRSPRFTFSTR